MVNIAEGETVLEKIFDRARNNAGLDYVYTLVRLGGITHETDLFLRLQTAVDNWRDASVSKLSVSEIHDLYLPLIQRQEPFAFLTNLLHCVDHKPYDAAPFVRGDFPYTTLGLPEIVVETVSLAQRLEELELAEMVKKAFPFDLLTSHTFLDPDIPREALILAGKAAAEFTALLLYQYRQERLKTIKQAKLYKLTSFEVLELLAKDDEGLYGFCVHFSNGCSARYERHATSTQAENISLSPMVNFFAGYLDQLVDEWRIGDKRLYEVGLPGRYNKLGEWKPIIYPVKPNALLEEARIASKDLDVQGALFYMMCTGHRVIEFVVKTAVELPKPFASFENGISLSLCPPIDGHRSVFIYDGWLDLQVGDTEEIEAALRQIDLCVNILAFTFSAAVEWHLKYHMMTGSNANAQPTEQDMLLFDSMLKGFPSGDDFEILNFAISWYTRAVTSRNIFDRYFGFYVVIEHIGIALAEGHADLGLGYIKDTRAEKKRKRDDCIGGKFEALYQIDRRKFVEEAYFDCLTTLKQSTKRVAELVFGEGHHFVSALFEKRDGYSLHDIRSRITHGGFTMLRREDRNVVLSRLGEMKHISKEFLFRLIFGLRPDDVIPEWSETKASWLDMSNPRNTLFSTTDTILPNKDWRIRPEWFD